MSTTDSDAGWNSVQAHSDATGPVYDTASIPYEVGFSTQPVPQTFTTYNLDRTLKHCARSVRMDGQFDSSGFRHPTSWYRGVLHCISLQGFDFVTEVSGGNGYYRHRGDNSRSHMAYTRSTIPGWDHTAKSLEMNSLEADAKSKCMERIASQKIDLSESLAGAVTTFEYVCSLYVGFAQLLVLMSRNKWSAVAQRLGVTIPHIVPSVADGWLQYQYALKPLVNDIRDGIELLKAQLQEGNLLQKATATSTERLRDTAGWSLPYYHKLAVSSAENKRSARVECFFKVNDQTARQWASVNLDSALYFGWVATPYSFVVDWFIPVGEWLSSLNAHTGSEFVAAHVTKRLQIDSTAEGWNIFITHDKLYEDYENQLPSSRLEVMVIKREVLLTWPVPGLYVNTSPFRSPTRVINAVALVSSNWK